MSAPCKGCGSCRNCVPEGPRFPYTERPAEQEFAVVVAALLAGRIDGQQAIASLTALHERMAAGRASP